MKIRNPLIAVAAAAALAIPIGGIALAQEVPVDGDTTCADFEDVVPRDIPNPEEAEQVENPDYNPVLVDAEGDEEFIPAVDEDTGLPIADDPLTPEVDESNAPNPDYDPELVDPEGDPETIADPTVPETILNPDYHEGLDADLDGIGCEANGDDVVEEPTETTTPTPTETTTPETTSPAETTPAPAQSQTQSQSVVIVPNADGSQGSVARDPAARTPLQSVPSGPITR